MRIISGSFKGKKIFEPKDIKTRPLKDLTKESIFNIINHSKKFRINLENSNILDLFSGVGSFGIECLYRGVKKVVFVENYSGVLPILKKNLSNLKSMNNFEIFEKDVFEYQTFLNFNKKFDIIFLDPPYRNKSLENLLINIYSSNILNNEGIIIIHRHKKEEDIVPKNYKILEKKYYGISKIIFLTIVN